MSIKVKYFASIRERLGRDQDELSADRAGRASEVWAQATDSDWPANMLVAINQEHARPEDLVSDGDELAFFPPVTGG